MRLSSFAGLNAPGEREQLRLQVGGDEVEVAGRRAARAARRLGDVKLAEKRSSIRDLPCLDDQAVAEVREDDLVDLEGFPGGRSRRTLR